jgi:hypothetical protein
MGHYSSQAVNISRLITIASLVALQVHFVIDMHFKAIFGVIVA